MFPGPPNQGMWPSEMMGGGMQLGGPLDGGMMGSLDSGMMSPMEGGMMGPIEGGMMHPMPGPGGPVMPTMMGMGLMGRGDGGRGRGWNARGPRGPWGPRPDRRLNMCHSYQRNGTCVVGATCKYAHGAEWLGSPLELPMMGPAPPGISAPRPGFGMGNMPLPTPPQTRPDAGMGMMMPRPTAPRASLPLAPRQPEEEVVDPADVAAVSYLDRVKATLAIAGIGNADLKKHSPAAGAAAVYAIRSGEAFQASPYADAVLQYLPH